MQDAVLVDLAAKVRPGVDVLFLDTGYHFVETIGTRDAVEAVYDINVVNVTPENSVAKQDELFGKDLFAREASECCRMRKVEPLGKALRGYSAWVTGIRRVEAPTRANAPLISWDKAFGLVKINPIAAWSDEDMQNYIDANDVLVNPLVFEGYPSIGCAPCTAKPVEGADPRSGRWAGPDQDGMRAARVVTCSMSGGPRQRRPAFGGGDACGGRPDPAAAALARRPCRVPRADRPEPERRAGEVAARAVVVVPFLLADAYHASVDIPAMIEESGAAVRAGRGARRGSRAALGVAAAAVRDRGVARDRRPRGARRRGRLVERRPPTPGHRTWPAP